MTARDIWPHLLARVESQAAARREAVAQRLAERLAGEYPDLEVTRQGSMVTLSGKALRERRAREAGLRWPGWGRDDTCLHPPRGGEVARSEGS